MLFWQLKNKVDPLDVEVIPPRNPGKRGVTQREMNAIQKSEQRIDPLDVEVIPPRNPGKRGVTQRELHAILASEQKIDPLDLEVIPPRNPGETRDYAKRIECHEGQNDNRK